MRSVRLALALVVACVACVAAPRVACAQTYVVIVSGLGGEPKYSRLFADLSRRLSGALRSKYGVPASDVTWLGEDSAAAPGYGGRSTKVNVTRVLSDIAGRAQQGAQVVLVLIGHGAGEGEESRIDLPGPDITAAELAVLFGRFSSQKVALVDLTSASGDMIPVLSAPGRVIITATKTALERNESHFAEFFVDALDRGGADADKDGRVSLLEAFRYASRETKRLYDDASKIQTEHAQLDDNGDKVGSAEPDAKTGEGIIARRFFLDASKYAAGVNGNDPRIAALYAQRFAIEEQVDSLKLRKSGMAADAYDDALESLLVNLARKAREIRALEGRT